MHLVVRPLSEERVGLPLWAAPELRVVGQGEVEELFGPRQVYDQRGALVLLLQAATWKVGRCSGFGWLCWLCGAACKRSRVACGCGPVEWLVGWSCLTSSSRHIEEENSEADGTPHHIVCDVSKPQHQDPWHLNCCACLAPSACRYAVACACFACLALY